MMWHSGTRIYIYMHNIIDFREMYELIYIYIERKEKKKKKGDELVATTSIY